MLKCFTFVTLLLITYVASFPDPGQWSASYSDVSVAIFGIAKPLYSGSSVYISVNCESNVPHQNIELQWVMRQTSCYEDCLATDIYNPQVLHEYFICPMTTNYSPQIRFFVSKPVQLECSRLIHLEFINATFTTYSESVEIPEICRSAMTNMASSDGFSSERTQSESSVMDTHVRSRRNVTLTAQNKVSNDSSKDIKTASFNETSKITEDKKLNKKNSEDKTTVNYASYHQNNESLPSKNYGYISGPFSSPNSVKPGSKLASVDMDGIYLFILKIRSTDQTNFNVSVDIALKGDSGYLSAVDYPLLLFYAIMCGLYVIYAVAWLVMSALQWRDLLRIQFWIGAVILLGLMEKAVFYAEYQSINYTGQSVQGAILFAEILSCMKRTLARMLIIIVSLGFGIVKPRLGPMLHRIIGVGGLYFILGTIEGCLRVLKPKTDPGNQALMAGIPLALTDSVICWWIFSSLVQTIRTLRLRRNIVKLQLYRHFTNTLLFSVIGSVAFMTWSIQTHKLVNCITDWKELWVDEAYWHFLFSVILFVIMILWRPTNNNQRYAFTPLLDAMDDDEDDDDEHHLNNDAFGMKMRTTRNNSSSSPKQEETKAKQDEDLKWVEENIPSSITDVALPSLLDSDEEILTAKFERSKME